jgi:hypothetical protein
VPSGPITVWYPSEVPETVRSMGGPFLLQKGRHGIGAGSGKHYNVVRRAFIDKHFVAL